MSKSARDHANSMPRQPKGPRGGQFKRTGGPRAAATSHRPIVDLSSQPNKSEEWRWDSYPRHLLGKWLDSDCNSIAHKWVHSLYAYPPEADEWDLTKFDILSDAITRSFSDLEDAVQIVLGNSGHSALKNLPNDSVWTSELAFAEAVVEEAEKHGEGSGPKDARFQYRPDLPELVWESWKNAVNKKLQLIGVNSRVHNVDYATNRFPGAKWTESGYPENDVAKVTFLTAYEVDGWHWKLNDIELEDQIAILETEHRRLSIESPDSKLGEITIAVSGDLSELDARFVVCLDITCLEGVQNALFSDLEKWGGKYDCDGYPLPEARKARAVIDRYNNQ